MSVASDLALLCSAAGVVVVVLASRRPREGIAMAMTLWLAATLLRLGELRTWRDDAAVVAVFAVRQLVMRSMGRG